MYVYYLMAFMLIVSLAAALPVLCYYGWLWAVLGFVLCYVLLHGLYVLALYLASLTVKRNEPITRQNRFCLRGCSDIPALGCWYFGIRPVIIGREELPTDSRFLFVSNHRAMFDPLIVVDRLREYNVCFLSKPSNMQIPIVGRVAHAAGHMAIDRKDNRKALKTILQAADYLKRDMCSIGIYPEGTRSPDGELLPFHPGSFKIAQRAGVPVVISAIRGTEKVKNNAVLRRTRVELAILETVPAERVKEMSSNELSDYCRSVIGAYLSEKE